VSRFSDWFGRSISQRFSVKPSSPSAHFHCVFRRARPASAAVRAESVVRPSFPSASGFGTTVSPIRSASLEVLRPFNVCKPCCAIRGGQPSDHPASTFDAFNTAPPEVGRPRHARVPAVFSPCVHRAWRAPRFDPHGSRRPERVMRRGLSFARRSATFAPDPGTTGPDRVIFGPATFMGFV
jgi:hypothetical protein